MTLLPKSFRALLASTLFAACALSASAQSAALGGVSGVVRDSTGAVVAGIPVVVTNTGTGATRTISTDSAGHYAVTFLQPGTYEVILGGSGAFGKVDRKNVPVTVGDSITIDASLPAATVTQDVTVTSEAPLLDTEKVQQSQVVDQALVSNLPVGSRRFDSFVLLTPNVAADGNSGLLSYRGISGLYNTNLVDGANNNQAFFSEARGRSIGAPYVYPVDAIQEFESSAAGYSAELGGAAGGIINAITKSGTNKFHGDVFEYYRTPGFNALDAVAKQNFRTTGFPFYLQQSVKTQHQFGVSVGGPILKDKLFFHFAYDGYRKRNPIVYTTSYNTSTTNVANLVHLCDQGTTPLVNATTSGGVTTTTTYPTTIPGISPTQCANAVAYTQSQLGAFPRNLTQDIYFPRFDYQLNSRTHLSASFLYDNFKQPNGYNSSVTTNNGGISQNGTVSFHERFLVANAETALSSTSANVVHFQWARDLETAGTNTGGPAENLTNFVSFGETSALPRGAFPDEHRWQITDVYSKAIGRHNVKAGIDLNFIHEQIANLFGGNGAFSYSNSSVEINFANFVQDAYGVNPTGSNIIGAPGAVRHYNSFSQTVDQLTGNGADDFWNQNIAGFIEDAWKPTPSLLLSTGLRYDVQVEPGPDLPNMANPVAYNATRHIGQYYKMIQPRLGFSWNPMPGTVVRGGYGIFYGLISNSAYYTERRENGVYQRQYGPINATTANIPYTACAAGTACKVNYQNNGSYVAYAPVGGVPIYLPPGPAPINFVTGAAVTPVGLAAVPTGTITIRGLDPSFINPSSQSVDLAIEQVLPLKTTFSVSYVGNRGLHLPIYVDTNVDPASVRNDLTYNYTANGTTQVFSVPVYTNKLYASTGTVATGFSDVNSWYHSLVFSVKKPLSYGVQVLANYTWAHSMDGGQASGTNGTFNGTDAPLIPFATGRRSGRGAEYSRSDLDQRGRFVGTLLATSKFPIGNRMLAYAANGWQLSGTYVAQTGFPVTGFITGAITRLTGGAFGTPVPAGTPTIALTDGGVTNAVFTSGTATRVPDFIARRNSFKGPGLHNLDARVSRIFPVGEGMRFEIAAEAFNVANHRNILAINTNYVAYTAGGTGTGTGASLGTFTPFAQFGTPTATSGTLYGERQLQLLGKFYF